MRNFSSSLAMGKVVHMRIANTHMNSNVQQLPLAKPHMQSNAAAAAAAAVCMGRRRPRRLRGRKIIVSGRRYHYSSSSTTFNRHLENAPRRTRPTQISSSTFERSDVSTSDATNMNNENDNTKQNSSKSNNTSRAQSSPSSPSSSSFDLKKYKHLFRALGNGQPSPLGASLPDSIASANGSYDINLAVHVGEGAGRVTLALFTEDSLMAGEPVAELELDGSHASSRNRGNNNKHKNSNRTGNVWHISLLGVVHDSLLYAWKVRGIHEQEDRSSSASNNSMPSIGQVIAAGSGNTPSTSEVQASTPVLPYPGQRFNGECYLLDPYAKGVLSARRYWGFDGQNDSSSGSSTGSTSLEQWPLLAGVLPKPSHLNSGRGPSGLGLAGLGYGLDSANVSNNSSNSSFFGNADERGEFDWQGDRPLNYPLQDLVIYEMHVRGFTMSRDSGVADTMKRGTFAGMIEKLDHLQELGVNAVELLPIHEFNEMEYWEGDMRSNDSDNNDNKNNSGGRVNYWGYSTVNFFSPNARYSSAAKRLNNCDGGRKINDEFKTLVRECHKRGLEVILDVVFNHTAEGNEMGPTLSFRGLDNSTYYTLAAGGEYYNYSGCGNTFNCNHPLVIDFIVDCLRYWVLEMHVDGFRFDLASIMMRANSLFYVPGSGSNKVCQSFEGRESGAVAAVDQSGGNDSIATSTSSAAPTSSTSVPEIAGYVLDNGEMRMTDGRGHVTGTPLAHPPLIAAISSDPILKDTKLIAEAWDADGLNQVGAFPHFHRSKQQWAEWNGVFRDNLRNFIKGSEGDWTGKLAAAICGSLDMYAGHEPDSSHWWACGSGREWYGNRGQQSSINFITAHDGFTMRDLVSYNDKHNAANGEDNRDGENHNLSWNCGEEGVDSVNSKVNRIRSSHIRNFVVSLMLAQGVPMIHMGDEYGHSKGGNNNTYCHDNELNWFDWSLLESERDKLFRFTKHLIRLRRATPELRQADGTGTEVISWHGTQPLEPDWSAESNLIAFSMPISGPFGSALYCCFNVSHVPVVVTLPALPSGDARLSWTPFVDTGKPSPLDVLVEDDIMSSSEVAQNRDSATGWIIENQYPVMPRSCVILLGTHHGSDEYSDETTKKKSSFVARNGMTKGRGRVSARMSDEEMKELETLLEENKKMRSQL